MEIRFSEDHFGLSVKGRIPLIGGDEILMAGGRFRPQRGKGLAVLVKDRVRRQQVAVDPGARGAH